MKKGKLRTPQDAYSSQKGGAKRRGINWYFTLESWLKWWEKNLGPDWFKKRGPGHNQYCMARKGDKGPYAAWNVECKTIEQNHREHVLPKGEQHCRAILTEQQVIKIRNSSTSISVQVRKYGVSARTVRDIRKRLTWKHIE